MQKLFASSFLDVIFKPTLLPEKENMWIDMKIILIIDDDRLVSHLFKKILSHEGYDVVVAPDGESGIKVLEEKIVDLVLLDLAMPGLHGLEVLRIIRERWEKLPVLVTTGSDSVENERRAQDLKADGFLCKPVDLYVLRGLLETTLSLTGDPAYVG